MKKKFKVLRIIGTLWKMLAWIVLVGGILSSIGILLAGLLVDGGLSSQFGQQMGQSPLGPFVTGARVAVVGFIGGLIVTAGCFLVLYAVGEMIYLQLAIEENTRLTTQWIQYQVEAGQQSYQTPTPPQANRQK
ncbi:MAG: hypothetical protein R6U98_36665 [Pirellulaceae bacterium]